MIAPPLLSLLGSCAFGEALLFLATSSPIRITDRRIALVRELTRVDLARQLGFEQGQNIPQRLLARERVSILNELTRAAGYGTTVTMQRYRAGTVASRAVGGTAA